MSKLRMSWPNRITLGRILMIVPFVIAMLYINNTTWQGKDMIHWPRYAALLIFLIMAVSDALDGWLARRSNTVTSLGIFLDPLADKLLITCACLLLSSESFSIEGMQLPKAIMVIIIGKDVYMVLGFIVFYLITTEIKVVPMIAGKLSTLLQLSMVVAILISPDVIPVFGGFRIFVQFLWWVAATVAILATIVYTRNGTRYLNEYEQRQKKAN